MSRRERDNRQYGTRPDDAPDDARTASESSSEAEDSAANIAELVRRTGARRAAPGPSVVARPDVQVARPDVTARLAPTTAGPVAAPVLPAIAQPVARPTEQPPEQPHEHPSPAGRKSPSRPLVVVAAAVAVLLVGTGIAVVNTFGTDDPTPPVAAAAAKAPTGYSVKVTDRITDCASHSRGRTKDSFKTQNCVKATRLLATGRVGGRSVLFVVSRIEMASPETAASVKQVLDGNGTGNLNDLLREGKTFRGAPARMPGSGYASVQTGSTVSVAEAGFIDGGRSTNTDPALRSAAAQAAGMVSAQR